MGTTANVIVDEIQGVFYSAVATAAMTATGTLGGSVTTTDWTDLGFVNAEDKIKLSFSGNEIVSRPLGMEGNLKKVIAQKKCEIEFMGLEDVIANLALALSGTVGSNEMPDGGDAEAVYKALSIITTNKIYHFKKVAPVFDTEKEIGDDDWAKTPFKLETFVEEAATAGERQWNIMERTAA